MPDIPNCPMLTGYTDTPEELAEVEKMVGYNPSKWPGQFFKHECHHCKQGVWLSVEQDLVAPASRVVCLPCAVDLYGMKGSDLHCLTGEDASENRFIKEQKRKGVI